MGLFKHIQGWFIHSKARRLRGLADKQNQYTNGLQWWLDEFEFSAKRGYYHYTLPPREFGCNNVEWPDIPKLRSLGFGYDSKTNSITW